MCATYDSCITYKNKHHTSISKDIKGSWTLPNKSQLDTCFVFVPIIYPAIWHEWIQQKKHQSSYCTSPTKKNILLRIPLTVNLRILGPKRAESKGKQKHRWMGGLRNDHGHVGQEKSENDKVRLLLVPTHRNTQNKKKTGFCGSIMMHQLNFWETRPQIHAKLWCFMKLKSSRGGGFHRPKS